MSTNSSTDTTHDTDETHNSNTTDQEYYFEDIPDALDELEYFKQRYETATTTLTTIHDQLETIDCDVGCATASFDNATLTATMTVPTIEENADTVLKSHNWETIDITYNSTTEMYDISLEIGFPLFARIINIDYKSPTNN